MRRSNAAFSLALFLAAAPLAAQQQEQQEQEETAHADTNVPWQAQIYSSNAKWTPQELETRKPWDLAHKCGGTLIAAEWVLTAAHCINSERVRNGHRIRLGAASIAGDEGMTFRIDRIVRHADYNAKKHYYDVALVHFVADDLTKPGNVREIEPIALYDGPPLRSGTKVFATGWGKADEADKGFQSDLTQVDLEVADCSTFPEYAGETTDYQLCASAPDNDTCTGDSGGPLVLAGDDPVLVGVVNWGHGCYREHSAGVYLRVDRSNFRDWIARAMAAEASVSELR